MRISLIMKNIFLKKRVRIALRIAGVLVAVLICMWTILWAYVTYNKVGIIEKVKARINQQVKGKVEIGDLSIDFFHNFPNISVRLSNVSIRDSLWDRHHHDFLKAENIYARLQLLSLFSGKLTIGKLTVEKALIYYYTDTTGYSNLVKANGSIEKNNRTDMPDLLFINTRIIVDNPGRHKFHDIELKEMECNAISTDSGQLLRINMNALVNYLGFNTLQGSYLKEKTLTGEFNILLTKAKEIQFDQAKLIIDDQPFLLSGIFLTGTDHDAFSLSIHTRKINFKKAIGLLTDSTQRKFDAYDIVQPIEIDAVLNGSMAYASIPLAGIGLTVKDADIKTPEGRFSNCSFTGNFTNEINPAKPRFDENSALSFKNFSGKWENIPFTSNGVEISNLTVPFLNCNIHSSFNAAILNDLVASSSIQFMKGKVEMDIGYKGSLINNDTIETVMDGNIRLAEAEIEYLPRHIILKNLQTNLVFKNKDLFIEQLQAQAGATALNMTGTVRNLMQLIYKDPEKLTLEWNIATPYLDLADFIGYLGKKSMAISKKAPGKNKDIPIVNRIDRMLEYGTAKLNIQAGKVNYKKFTATNVSTSLSMQQNEMILNSARLNHAGGSIVLSGTLSDEGTLNFVKLKSTITNVDIPSLFHAFNNFGQEAITGQNMKGRLSAVVDLSTSISDKAVINENNLKSTVNFSVINGELNDFEPLQKMSTSIFKKRDFSRVRFAELKDKLELNGSAFTINKMEIRSNVFTMFVEGVYDSKKGTDMSIQVPLRNLKKIDDDEILINKKKAGMNIRLRAKTGDDGKLKISWDPFRKGGRNNKDM